MRLEIIITKRRYEGRLMYVLFTLNGKEKMINNLFPKDITEEQKTDKWLLDAIVKYYCKS
jgi:hypothetical protein